MEVASSEVVTVVEKIVLIKFIQPSLIRVKRVIIIGEPAAASEKARRCSISLPSVRIIIIVFKLGKKT